MEVTYHPNNFMKAPEAIWFAPMGRISDDENIKYVPERTCTRDRQDCCSECGCEIWHWWKHCQNCGAKVVE